MFSWPLSTTLGLWPPISSGISLFISFKRDFSFVCCALEWLARLKTALTTLANPSLSLLMSSVQPSSSILLANVRMLIISWISNFLVERRNMRIQ